MNLRSQTERRPCGVGDRLRVRIRSAARLPALLMLAIFLAGCAHHPETKLYHRTVISYFPLRTPLKTKRPTDCVVEPYAYGYQGTHWRAWADEWGAEYELIPDLKATPTPAMEPYEAPAREPEPAEVSPPATKPPPPPPRPDPAPANEPDPAPAKESDPEPAPDPTSDSPTPAPIESKLRD